MVCIVMWKWQLSWGRIIEKRDIKANLGVFSAPPKGTDLIRRPMSAENWTIVGTLYPNLFAKCLHFQRWVGSAIDTPEKSDIDCH